MYAILSKRERLGGRGLWRCGGGAAGDAPAYSPSDPGAAPLVRPASREEPTKLTTPTRRTLPRTALATTVLAAPSVAYAAGNDAPSSLTDRYDDHSNEVFRAYRYAVDSPPIRNLLDQG